jgi:hypothetical protein
MKNLKFEKTEIKVFTFFLCFRDHISQVSRLSRSQSQGYTENCLKKRKDNSENDVAVFDAVVIVFVFVVVKQIKLLKAP